MIVDLTNITLSLNAALIVKVTALIFIGLYAVFSFMLATKIRSFNKILFLPPDSGGSLMQKIAIIYFVVVAILFLLALIML